MAETLTRADVQHDIQKALELFAENAMRREMEQLGALVRQAIQETLGATKSPPAAVAACSDPPCASPRAVQPKEPRPLLFRKDLRIELSEVLNEWWSKAATSDEVKASPAGGANDAKEAPEKKPLPHSNASSDAVTRSTTASTSLPESPLSLPALTSSSELLPPSTPPSNSPSVTPAGSPATPTVTPAASPYIGPSRSPSCFAAISSPYLSAAGDPADFHFDALPPSRYPSRKDWRRSFVDRATKTNRKVEYLHSSTGRDAHDVNEAVEEAIKALEDGVKPHLVEDGLGGTYFIKDRSGKSIAVFKPRDEEPMAPNNPKVHAGGGQGSGLKDGVLVGEAAINEYASFLIDSASSLRLRAGICPTALVKVANSVFHSANEDPRSAFRKIKDKVGSFQLFASHDCTSEDIGASRFPDDQVHRLAALDIRLCNTDRHSGNILVREQRGQVTALIPIDHGYALPGEIGGDVTFEWLSWPAAKRPFSEEMRAEILAISSDTLEAMLRKQVPELRSECLMTLRACTTLLQHGVAAGLTAFDIGSLMLRPTQDVEAGNAGEQELSALEKLVAAARQEAEKQSMQLILDRLIEEECKKVAEQAASHGS